MQAVIDRWREGTATLSPLLLSLAALMDFTLSGALPRRWPR